MAIFNSTTAWGVILSGIGEHIFGDYQLVGVWLLILFIGLAFAFGLKMDLTLVLMIPLVVGSLAVGAIYPVVGGVIILFVAFILAANFIIGR